MSTVRWMVIAATAAVVSLAPAPARAQEASNELPSTRHKDYSSPQNFAIEIRGGSYRPEIDSDPNLSAAAAPYYNTFGGRRALIAMELDWQAFRIPHVGTIGPGIAAGFTRMSAQARIKGTDRESAEKTYLQIIPFYAVAVLRLDVVARELKIPLVPYAKVGVGYALWSSSTDTGVSRAPDAANPDLNYAARGGTFGTHFAGGIALQLNAFDRQTARNFDTSMGVNNTYLFIEAMRMNLNGLAQKNAMPVGDVTWATGIAFEF